MGGTERAHFQVEGTERMKNDPSPNNFIVFILLMLRLQGKVEELKVQVQTLQPAPLEGYKTYKNDERRVVEILHKNELEKHDNERRLQYEKLVHEFVVRLFNFANVSLCVSLFFATEVEVFFSLADAQSFVDYAEEKA